MKHLRIKTTKRLIHGIMILTLLFMLIQSQTVMAEIAWEETFDEGLPQNWTVSHGAVDVSSGYLEVTDCVTVLTVICFASIWGDHNEITGKWTMDYYRENSTDSEFSFNLAATGVSTLDVGDFTGGWPNLAYCVIINSNTRFDQQGLPEVRIGLTQDGSSCDGSLTNQFDLPQGNNEIVIEHDGTELSLTVNGEFVDRYLTSNVIKSAEQINIAIGMSDRIDNIVYDNNQTIPPISFDYTPLIAGLVIMFVLGTGYLIYRRYTQSKMSSSKSRLELLNKTKRQFELSDHNLFALLGLSNKNKISTSQSETTKHEILNFKYLLHPVRLLIIKILDSESEIQSATIRSYLGIKWGEYGQHLKSLEENNYISTKDIFDENASLTKIAEITPFGSKQYSTLVNLLQDLINEDSAIGNMLYGKIDRLSDNLYPE